MSSTLRNALAATVAAAGLTIGGIGFASADETATDTTSSSTSSTAAGLTADGHRGPGGPGFRDGSDLADALGVTEAELKAAFEAIRDDLDPPAGIDRDNPPTEAERTAMREKLAAALAAELDLTKAKVLAALDKVHAAHEAEARTALSERLDEAVTAGDLTTADKASVLKAFDAGVLGGPHR